VTTEIEREWLADAERDKRKQEDLEARPLLTKFLSGTPEWYAARCGRATSSCFADVLAKGQGVTRTKYLRRVLSERLTGKPFESYHNAHMDRGTEQEPFARIEYEALTGALVEEVGFVPHPEIMAGASPDGLIGDEGGCECKCVIPTVQVDTLLRGKYPPEHKAQIMGNLWISGRQWWDFISFCPDMPPHLRIYVYRVTPDQDYITNLEKEVRAFLAEIDELYARLMNSPSLAEKLEASIKQREVA
jgi:hypothetical protein